MTIHIICGVDHPKVNRNVLVRQISVVLEIDLAVSIQNPQCQQTEQSESPQKLLVLKRVDLVYIKLWGIKNPACPGLCLDF